MRHHLPQKVLHSKGGSHKDTLLCTPLLWDTPGLNIFNEDWPAESTRAGDSDTRRTMTPPEGGAMYSFAREVLIPHLKTHLGWKCPVVNGTTFIVVKAGTVDVEKKQCWHRDINLSYVVGPDQHHVICLFPMFSPTPDDGCAGDFVVASHTGLPDPWVVAPMAPLDIGDVWLGNAWDAAF